MMLVRLLQKEIILHNRKASRDISEEPSWPCCQKRDDEVLMQNLEFDGIKIFPDFEKNSNLQAMPKTVCNMKQYL